jgi:uncharacterized protein
MISEIASCASSIVSPSRSERSSPASRPERYTRSEPYSPPYHANPSFPCVGDLSWEQRAICSDEALAAQDRELADLSRRVSAYADADELRRINDRWSREWDRCGGSGSIPGCLSWVYREWLEALGDLRPPAALGRVSESESQRMASEVAEPSSVPGTAEVRRSSPFQTPDSAGQAYREPVPAITCILPSGQENQMSIDQCRQSSGVIYRERD